MFFGLWTIIFFFMMGIPGIVLVFRWKNLGEDQKTKGVKGIVVLLLTYIFFLVIFEVYFHYSYLIMVFKEMGYENRLWIELKPKLACFFIGFGISGTVVSVFSYSIFRSILQKNWVLISFIIGLFFGTIFGSISASYWEELLLLTSYSSGDTLDPIFSKPIEFYFFALPVYDSMLWWSLGLFVICAIILVVTVILKGNSEKYGKIDNDDFGSLRVYGGILFGTLLAIIVIMRYLSLYGHLFNSDGIYTGVRYNDLAVGFPCIKYTILVLALFSLMGFLSALSESAFAFLFFKKPKGDKNPDYFQFSLIKGVFLPLFVFFSMFFVSGFIPYAWQEGYVIDNALKLERPFLEYTTDWTKKSYELNNEDIEVREVRVFPRIHKEVLRSNADVTANARLWDWEILRQHNENLQSLAYYWTFTDTDLDRYKLDGTYIRQVMVSLRELNVNRIPDEFIQEALIFTHAKGIVINPVNVFDERGGPIYFAKQVPTVTPYDIFKINDSTYYGEANYKRAYVNTKQKELDYVSGGIDVFSKYEGEGGIRFNSFMDKLIIAHEFDDLTTFINKDITNESKILVNRNIIKRAKILAPFLIFDEDPYPVASVEKTTKWILDAYTTSSNYPYAMSAGSFNYIRNSVKAVIDAYHGTIDFYIFDEEDPIIMTYAKIFPGLFKPKKLLPKDLLDHLRVPDDILKVRSHMYGIFHVDTVDQYFSENAVWQISREKYFEKERIMIPYYTIIRLSENEPLEFVNMIPFSYKDLDLMAGWMAARCDQPYYGDLIVYKFPEGEKVLGAMNVETLIQQRDEITKQLNLWNKENISKTLKGNMLIIPLFYKTEFHILYIKPIYLQSLSENDNRKDKMPELVGVVVGDQKKVVFGKTLDDALSNLIGEHVSSIEPTGEENQINVSPSQILNQVKQLFELWQKSLAEKEYSRAGEQIEKIEEVLNNVNN